MLKGGSVQAAWAPFLQPPLSKAPGILSREQRARASSFKVAQEPGCPFLQPPRPPLGTLGPAACPGLTLSFVALWFHLRRGSTWLRKSSLKVSQRESRGRPAGHRGWTAWYFPVCSGCLGQSLVWICARGACPASNHIPGNPSSIWAEPLASPKPAERSGRRGFI